MPELPEVEVTRMGIAPHIEGATVVDVRLGKPLRWPLGCEANALKAQQIHAIRRRAKYIILDLDGGVLLIHLGMSGRLVFYKELPPPTKHDHFDLITTQGAVRLHDPRRFGAVVWAPSEQVGMADKLLGHLGMEPLGTGFDEKIFVQELKKRKAAIKQVLLSGSIVVGVGNIYASEVLFAAGIDPRKPACKISLLKAKKLAAAIQKILQQAIDYGGSTLKDFRSAEGEHGLFQLHAKVYGKKGEPCAVCGGEILNIQQGQRSTYFCKKCQK